MRKWLILLVLLFIGCVEPLECNLDSDCVVFGEDGDCNCGCYLVDDLPLDSDGECFCAAPKACECVSGKCEGIFE